MAQSSSRRFKARGTKRKVKGKAKKAGRHNLAKGLAQCFPLLGPLEWDFRWVASKEQEAAVVAYERAREIMRLAQDLLSHAIGEAGKAKEAWACFVTCGGLDRLMEAQGTPGACHYDLAKALSVLMPAKHRFSAHHPLPPSAFKVRKIFRMSTESEATKARLMFQEQVELPWIRDEEGDIPGDDRFAMLGWGDFPVPWPSRPIIMHVPMFGVLNHEEALEHFKSWIASTNPGMFSGSGRDDESALIGLAFFRFNQGRQGPKVWSRFKDALEASKVQADQESSAFGLGVYASVLGRYEALSVKWSQSIHSVADALSPLALRLAREAEIFFDAWRPVDPGFMGREIGRPKRWR